CEGVASGPSITLTGSPGMRWMSRNTTVTTTAITGSSASTRRTRYALRRSLLEPHVVEADAVRLLVEALHGGARGAEPEEIAVADDGDLLVEHARLLLPQGHALLGIRLAPQLFLKLGDVLVGGPARPARLEIDVMEGIVEGAHPGREHVVLLGIVPALHEGGPVHHLQVDVEADVLELLPGEEGEVVHPLVL